MKYDAIVLASGKGKRSKLDYNKVFHKLRNGKTVIENAFSLFLDDPDCAKVIVTFNQDEMEIINNQEIIKVAGGKERKDSVNNAFNYVTSEYVLIHDGARPYLEKQDLENLKKAVLNEKAAILAFQAFNTIKHVKDDYIINTLNREEIYEALTPQIFETNTYKECLDKVGDVNYTDDASLVEMFDVAVKVVCGNKENIKLTFKEDFDEKD